MIPSTIGAKIRSLPGDHPKNGSAAELRTKEFAQISSDAWMDMSEKDHRGMMPEKTAKATVTPVRQRTQYTCMSTSMMMCLRALGHEVTEDEVNKVMGARPMQGASWEQALACAQHYGCRATLTMPSTVGQIKEWTDRGVPVMIAWNPEGRPWSHASVVFDVDDEGNVHVADPNIPDPEETVRIVHKSDFYKMWSEKWPNYLVRRPACAIEREITEDGRQVPPMSVKQAFRSGKASLSKSAKKEPLPTTRTQQEKRDEKRAILVEAPKQRNEVQRAVVEQGGMSGGGAHQNKGMRGTGEKGKGKAQRHPKHKGKGYVEASLTELGKMASGLHLGYGGTHPKSTKAHPKIGGYSGNPDGKDIYPNEIDHGYGEPVSGGTDVIRRLQNQLLHEQGNTGKQRETRAQHKVRSFANTGLPAGGDKMSKMRKRAAQWEVRVNSRRVQWPHMVYQQIFGKGSNYWAVVSAGSADEAVEKFAEAKHLNPYYLYANKVGEDPDKALLAWRYAADRHLAELERLACGCGSSDEIKAEDENGMPKLYHKLHPVEMMAELERMAAKADDAKTSDWNPGEREEDHHEDPEGSDVPGVGDDKRASGKTAGTIDILWVLVSSDDYLFGATDNEREAHSKANWSYIVSREHLKGARLYELRNIPENVAERLVDMGTPAQWYADGYEAWEDARRFVKGRPMKLGSDTFDLESLYFGKEAATGLYGFPKRVQSDVSAASHRVAKVATEIARKIYSKDARVAEFWVTHGKRGDSLSSRVLAAALNDMVPRTASGEIDSNKISKLQAKREAMANPPRHYFTIFVAPGFTKWQHPSKTLTRGAFEDYDEALRWANKNIPNEPYAIGMIDSETGDLIEKLETYYTVILPPGYSKWQDPRRSLSRGAFSTKAEGEAWVRKNVPDVTNYEIKMIRPASEQKAAGADKEARYGLYGFRSRTSKLGLQGCSDLRHEAGGIASDLHRRRSSEHSRISEYLRTHIKEAGCNYSRLLLDGYPDADRKLASLAEPETVSDWIAWED